MALFGTRIRWGPADGDDYARCTERAPRFSLWYFKHLYADSQSLEGWLFVMEEPLFYDFNSSRKLLALTTEGVQACEAEL